MPVWLRVLLAAAAGLATTVLVPLILAKWSDYFRWFFLRIGEKPSAPVKPRLLVTFWASILVAILCGPLAAFIPPKAAPGEENAAPVETSELSMSGKRMENIEILLDCSDAMSEPYGQTTIRFQAALHELERLFRFEIANSDSIALRSFGGGCNSTDTHLLVGLGPNQKAVVAAEAAALELGGRAPLTSAIIEATGDFNLFEHYEGANRRIVVITGSDDFCAGEDTGESIARRLDRRQDDIQLDIILIGIDWAADHLQRLLDFALGTGGYVGFRESESSEPIPADVVAEIEDLVETGPTLTQLSMETPWQTIGLEHMTGSIAVVKVKEDDTHTYYVALTSMRRRGDNVGAYLAQDVAVWTQDEAAELLYYSPTSSGDRMEPRLELPTGEEIEFPQAREDMPSNMIWKASPTIYESDLWRCTQVTWEVAFEASFCWERAVTVMAWMVPREEEQFLDVLVVYASAQGSCFARFNDTTTEQKYIRIDLGEFDWGE